MGTLKLLETIFGKLNEFIETLNKSRSLEGGVNVAKAKVRLLGQISLLAMDYIVKKEFRNILLANGLIYDEDSHLIWIPPGAKFEEVFDLKNLLIKSIDAESALVSKAVKAPQKNKQLIREAIASDYFPKLADRIVKNGGKLKDFV